MTNNPETPHHRRSIRLQGHDYSQNGAYFVTLCTHNNKCLFGALVANNGSVLANNEPVGANNHSPAVALNDAGLAVSWCWSEIPNHFPFVELDAFIAMPNHVHGILSIAGDHSGPVRERRANDYSPLRKGTSETIGSIVRGFKIGVTKWFKENRPDIDTVWQRNYYEHVIRNDDELNEVRQYIANNPIRANDHPFTR